MAVEPIDALPPTQAFQRVTLRICSPIMNVFDAPSVTMCSPTLAPQAQKMPLPDGDPLSVCGSVIRACPSCGSRQGRFRSLQRITTPSRSFRPPAHARQLSPMFPTYDVPAALRPIRSSGLVLSMASLSSDGQISALRIVMRRVELGSPVAYRAPHRQPPLMFVPIIMVKFAELYSACCSYCGNICTRKLLLFQARPCGPKTGWRYIVVGNLPPTSW